MQISFGISSILHAALLSWALLSFGAPKSLDVADVDAVPVSIVPFEDITQVMRGVEDASAKDTAAPNPTESKRQVEDAVNIGENKVDLKSIDAPKPSDLEVVSRAPPKAEPTPRSDRQPTPTQTTPDIQPEPETQTAPATEVATLPSEQTPVRQDPIADAIKTVEPLPQEQKVLLPKTGPVPILRNMTAPAQTAKTPDRKNQELVKKSPSAARESAFDSDQIASLLNRADSEGGGALSSQKKAGLGANNAKSGSTLSQSEMDALRAQIQDKWNIIPGLADGGEIRITISMQLDRSGQIIGQPDVTATGGSVATRQTLARSAKRAVLQAQPYQLPIEKYETWSNVIVNFDPSELF